MNSLQRDRLVGLLAGRRDSRRAVLSAGGAALAATALSVAGPARLAPAAHRAAQVATPQAGSMNDLTGVTPLPLTGERLATFEAYVDAKVAELGVPGAAVAVVQDGEVAFLQGFGVRELGRPAPVTADTLIRIGSVTKSFSSLLAATLVDAGRLSWETPLVDLLPTFAVADLELTPRLTVADAFCACTGLPRRDFEFIFNGHQVTPERVVADMERLPLTAAYGERYQYSNQMVAAGGWAAAVADGGSPTDLGHAYDIALRERVLNPIGMERSTLSLSEVVVGNDYAVPHAEDISGAVHPMPLLEDDIWLVPGAPSGALWSSAREMARYVQTELSRGVSPDGVRVVSAENSEETWAPGVAMPAPAAGGPPELATLSQHYGLGWATGAFGGQRLVWHAGATLGFHSRVTFLPEADLGVVMLTNVSVGVAALFNLAATYRLLELAFDLPATIDAALAPALAAAAQAPATLVTQLGQVDPAAVSSYLGRWTNPDLGEATLTMREGKLEYAAGGLRSELRPLVGASGAVTGYLFVDAPLGGFAQELMVTLEEEANGRPQVMVTVKNDDGEDLVYPFAPTP